MVAMKKPQTAFFIFSGERRQSIKDELLKEKGAAPMGEVAKAIGIAWKALSDAEREKYQHMATEQKAAYAKALEEAGGDADRDGGGDAEASVDTGKARTHSALPLSMVKKLVTMDDEVKRISGDALKVITEATGLFLGNLASKSIATALANKKKNFKFEDIVSVAKRDPRLVDMGLVKAFEEQDPFKGWLGGSGVGGAGGNVQRKRAAEGGAEAGEKKKAVATHGGIAAFLTKKKDQADAVDIVDVVEADEDEVSAVEEDEPVREEDFQDIEIKKND